MVNLKKILRVLITKHVTIANFPELYKQLTQNQKKQIEFSIKEYSDHKKWIDGRANFPLRILIKTGLSNGCLWRILKKASFSAKGVSSKFRIKLPLEMNGDLAYFLGVLAGDWSISKPKPHHRGGWTVQMHEDNFEYQTGIYKPLVERLFGCSLKLYKRKRKDGRANLYSAINSVIAVLYLTKVLGIKNGFKADVVSIPGFIYKNKELSLAYVQGLFDTDGTVTGGTAKFSTVSKQLFDQVRLVLNKVKIKYYTNTWLKNDNVRLLYTIIISKKFLTDFDKLIGFQNLKKQTRLKQLIAPSSSRPRSKILGLDNGQEIIREI